MFLLQITELKYVVGNRLLSGKKDKPGRWVGGIDSPAQRNPQGFVILGVIKERDEPRGETVGQLLVIE